jgi:hypothetical protein
LQLLQASFCDIHNVGEDKLSCEYLAFTSHKKITSASPTLAILDAFEKELSKRLEKTKASKATLENLTSCAVYDSSNLPLSDTSFGNSDMVKAINTKCLFQKFFQNVYY